MLSENLDKAAARAIALAMGGTIEPDEGINLTRGNLPRYLEFVDALDDDGYRSELRGEVRP